MRSRLLAALAASVCSSACGSTTPPPAATTTAHESAETLSAPEPRRARAYGPPHSTGPTYEAALDTPEDISSLAGERDLSDDELGGPLKQPSFLTDCSAPESMHVKVQVAVRDGAAIGVTVRTAPDDTTVAECIDRAVRGLQWPASKKRDSMTTVY
jgi:hypothetical protein